MQMNSWNRMPFSTQISSGGGAASYTPALTETTGMFIIANYGSSQGYDKCVIPPEFYARASLLLTNSIPFALINCSDDGSSYEHIHANLFYQADGLKSA